MADEQPASELSPEELAKHLGFELSDHQREYLLSHFEDWAALHGVPRRVFAGTGAFSGLMAQYEQWIRSCHPQPLVPLDPACNPEPIVHVSAEDAPAVRQKLRELGVEDGHWASSLPVRTWKFNGHSWVTVGGRLIGPDEVPKGFGYSWVNKLKPGGDCEIETEHYLTPYCRPNPTTVGEPVYERFTDRARKVMQLANQEAQRFGCEFVGVQHVLLALVKEGSGVAAHALMPQITGIHDLGASVPAVTPVQRQADALRAVRLECEKLFPGRDGGNDEVVLGKLPHSDTTKDLVERSIAACRRLNHAYVGTEHILLGLLAQDADSPANRVLTALQVKAVALEREVMLLLDDDGGKLTKAATEAGIPLPGSVYTHGDVDPAKWIAAADKTGEDPSDDGYLDYGGDDTKGESLHPAFMPAASVLHRVRGRTYTDESLRLAVDAALRVVELGDNPTSRTWPACNAANAFLTDLFGGPVE